MAGPTFEASGGTPNLGIYDQRLAREWIQKYIHLFGGDPLKVTIMGESSGAAIGMHQITAYGGTVEAPFQQAFLMSPGFDPNPYNWFQREVYQGFLAAANASSLADLRTASSAQVIAANEQVIWSGQYGATGFGPVVDGNIAPLLPSSLLAQGRFAKNVRAVVSAHNTDEGLIFANPAIQNTTAFNAFVASQLLPDAQPEIIDYVINTLYPPIFDNETGLGYNDTTSRLATLIADRFSICHAWSLLTAFNVSETHGILFVEGVGLHTEDTPYAFYNNGPTEDNFGIGVVNGTVAHELQDWMIGFGATGNNNRPGSAYVPVYGQNRSMGLMSNKGSGLDATDPAGLQRCEFWETALYY